MINFQESDEGIVSDQSSSADPDDANRRLKVRKKKKRRDAESNTLPFRFCLIHGGGGEKGNRIS